MIDVCQTGENMMIMVETLAMGECAPCAWIPLHTEEAMTFPLGND